MVGRKSRVRGTDSADELAPHSEVPGSALEVNGGVVHRNNALLPGEVSLCGTGGFQSTRKVRALVAAMRQVVQSEKSAEGIVVVDPRAMSRPIGLKDMEDSNTMKAQTKEEEATGGCL